MAIATGPCPLSVFDCTPRIRATTLQGLGAPEGAFDARQKLSLNANCIWRFVPRPTDVPSVLA